MIQMAMVYDGMSDTYFHTLEVINLIFTFIFIAEAVVKIIALGFKNYFINDWTKFDFFVVTASILDILLSSTNNSDSSMLRVGP